MNNNLMKKIGNKLRQRRQALGLRLQDMVDRVERLGGNIDQSSLSRIESGKQWPSEQSLNYILAALQCSFEELFMMTSPTGIKNSGTIGTRKLALLTDKQVAAYFKNNEFKSDEYVFTERELSLKAFSLKIDDDSMMPRFKPGDAVIIDPDIEPEPGNFVVAVDGDRSFFRQYRLLELRADGSKIFELHPLNEVFPVIRSDTSIHVDIAGTMVEHRLYDMK